jgi:Uma2 family endonuclease
MTLSQSHPYISPEKYLELEKNSPIKHEYIQGQIYAMADASDAHLSPVTFYKLLTNFYR